MTVAEGTRSRSGQTDLEGVNAALQEILRRLDTFDARLTTVESGSPTQGSSRLGVLGEDGEVKERESRRGEWRTELRRPSRVEFPVFDGDRVHDWIFRSERFFELDETPAELKVSVASVHLVGLAVEWHHTFVKNRRLNCPLSWEEYSSAMLLRFGPNELQRPIAQLKELREGESFLEYVNSFVSLVGRVELTDEDQIAMFIAGLRGTNKKLITLFNPRTLQQAIAYARTLAREEGSSMGGFGWQGSSGESRKPMVSPGTRNSMHSGVARSGSGWNNFPKLQAGPKPVPLQTSKSLAYQPPHRRVSPSEIEDRRAKGLCFWCDEKYTFGHKCAQKRLYSLILDTGAEEEVEAVEEDAVEEAMDNPTVTLHALHGVQMHPINQTMKLVGFLRRGV